MAVLHPPALDPEPLALPLLGRGLPAGFPSPADDWLEGEIDLARWLIERPAAGRRGVGACRQDFAAAGEIASPSHSIR